MKRHARLGGGAGRLLWVGDEADWRLMRSAQPPALVCPHPGCGDRLHPVRNERGTRFLRRGRAASGGDCPHWWVTGTAGGSGGGPESQRHLWMKARLASICLQLGWAAVPEDPMTRADVWVPDAGVALEVQLRRSDTLARTAARFRAGAHCVVWFVGADVGASRMLFRTPAVRFDVVDGGDPTRSVKPWEEEVDQARVVVFGTVLRWSDWRLTTGRVSAFAFLAELLAGRLGWCPPGTPHLPRSGGWVRWRDLGLALGLPDSSPEEIRAQVPVAPQPWIDAQLARRRRSPSTAQQAQDRGWRV